MEVCSQKASSDRSHVKENITKPHHVVLGGSNNVSPSSGPFGQVVIGSFTKPNLDHVNNDDVTSVLSELVRRKNIVIVGEGVANAEGVAREVMERFEVGNVPGDLRYVQFVSLPLMCFRNISKEEVEQKLMEIRNLVKSYVGRGVVLYLGDLKCDFQAQERSKVFFKDVAFEDRTGVRNHLTWCRDCLINFEKEAQSITNCISKKVCTASSLPMWLQNCKEERSDIMEDQPRDCALGSDIKINMVTSKKSCPKCVSLPESVSVVSYRKLFLLYKLLLANPGPAVTDKLYASSFANTIGEDKIFLTVAEAVAYYSPKLVEDP
ncbi:hypothetical protein JHK82_027889 [Glycine max]|nr:hypothetical protein JHK82_027889 [Glycine max]